ncbi:1-phosphatidylinositol 4,5-bisphosphate phosphodiesterase delta-1a isoform X1 [Megalobrama amblycephala]|uniref:1-phosphatidylinositol 4,5-bisphosphate phosphodiesterase delta-1a isoform X1 n=1 Tax=Megalobrama amblycephala TaxID=75352 RepID=UPI0020140E5D|nr:1-phosphatidylinositol 4,5-bisphosphate phosphodiesterase delta-1a isoform X1 [Megalobrama amblycephala]
MSCARKPRKRTKSQELIYQEQCKNVAHENGKRIGLEGDPDLQFLLKGGDLLKVKSRSWKKTRYFRLNEDCKTVWQNTSKKFKSDTSFSLEDVEHVRHGRQTEGLQKYTDSSIEDRCFSIIFKGRRNNLDLIASTKEEAKHWVSGLEKVINSMYNLNRQQNSEHWIYNCMRKADKNADNKMSLKELKHFLRQINIEVDDDYAKTLFKKCDTSNSGTLEGSEIKHFYNLLTYRQEIDVIYGKYAHTDGQMSSSDLLDFLQNEQREPVSLDYAHKLIDKFEVDEIAKLNKHMSKDGFLMYLNHEESSIFNPAHKALYQDMRQPLNHYFISSSHNTYLMEDQLKGPSSTEAYIKALTKGCRCVELDCWDGESGEPVIYHGHTLTSKVLFKDVIKAIKEYAFKTSQYPVILSLENHCTTEQQKIMAHHLTSILGSALLTQPLGHNMPTTFPGPEELKGRFLIKGKRLNKLDAAFNNNTSEDVDSVSEEDEAAELKEGEPKPKDKTSKKIKLAKELSDLVIYCKSVHFSNFEHSRDNQAFYEMASFKESKAMNLAENSATAFIHHNMDKLSRIYPAGSRTNSSNYNPVPLWNAGCQIVALNFQTPCKEMDLNQARFLPNGKCGYILKPEFQRDPGSQFDPINLTVGPWLQKKTLHLMIISAQQLPKINKDKQTSIVDPLVRVEIYGVPADNTSKETHHIVNNGFNPMWNTKFQFTVHVPELALVRFVVEDYDAATHNDLVGLYTVPFTSMQNGYRHVPLLTKRGSLIPSAGLFVHIMILDA